MLGDETAVVFRATGDVVTEPVDDARQFHENGEYGGNGNRVYGVNGITQRNRATEIMSVLTRLFRLSPLLRCSVCSRFLRGLRSLQRETQARVLDRQFLDARKQQAVHAVLAPEVF